MSKHQVIVVGGGAAGFFAAITCAEADPGVAVTLLERGPQFLSKVRISGGGRCNVTHACFETRALAVRYPRGERALLAPFSAFQPSDTVAWFAARGVTLKTEADGRMFPISDSSQTIVDCLVQAAQAAGVKLVLNCGVEKITRRDGGGFELTLTAERRPPARREGGISHEPAVPEAGTPIEKLSCDRLLLATGGCRAAASGELAVSLGHTLEAPVPSLFTFHIETPWLRELAGISIENVEAAIPAAKLRERGPVLVTHWGLSGPGILRLSAWGARVLHELAYTFPLLVNWLPHLDAAQVDAVLNSRRASQPAKLVVNTPVAPVPARLWEQLVLAAGIARETRWAELPRAAQHRLVQQLTRTELPVTGKSLNKDEFVTCGGVRLREVDFKTMESRVCPGLHFAGELLDIDGVTGGFNFQAAWTTGWLAGRAMALKATKNLKSAISFMKNKAALMCGLMHLTGILICNAQNSATNSIPLPKSYVEGVRSTVDYLFAWPDRVVLSGSSRMDSIAPEVAYAKTECLEWIKEVLDSAWGPSTNAEMYFLKNEFANHDVVRMAWNTPEFRVELSQTHALFAIKLIPINQQFFGGGIIQKIHAARDISGRIFNKNAIFYDSRKGQIPETLTNLTDLIESWSFAKNQVKSTEGGTIYRELQPGIVRYTPQTIAEPWSESVESHEYWFRNIYWWNNGQQIGFYFPKTKGYGARAAAFAGFVYSDSSDKNFFRLLR